MSELDRMKHLAGLTMESAKGLLQEFKGIGDKMPQPDPSAGAGFRPGKGFMSSEEAAREALQGIEGGPKPGTPEFEQMVQQLTDPSLGAGFVPGKGFAKADPNTDPSLYMKRPMRSEAVGDSAECFYDLQDEYCGEQCPSMPHKILIDELVRYLSGDQLQDFCDDFRRHHMDGMEESAVTELKKLAGLEEMGTVDMDRYDRNKKTKLKLPLSPELERLKKLGVDFKNYVTPGDGRREKPTYELPDIRDLPPMPKDDGRLEIPGYHRDKIRDLPPIPKDYGRINDFDDVRSRIDRIKNKPRDMYKFKWQGNQD